jgi:hypothetical protein
MTDGIGLKMLIGFRGQKLLAGNGAMRELLISDIRPTQLIKLDFLVS